MHHASVPFHLIRVGDVINRPYWGGPESFDVVTEVKEEWVKQDVNQVILSVGVGGARHRLEWRLCPDTEASMLDRVGEGCQPSAQGLQDFLAQQPR